MEQHFLRTSAFYQKSFWLFDFVQPYQEEPNARINRARARTFNLHRRKIDESHAIPRFG
jgi:hypothetical protein